MDDQSRTSTQNQIEDSTLNKKWGNDILASGWVGIPNLLLEYQARLKLTSSELNVLLAIMSFWWNKNSPAHPSVRTLAEMLGKSDKTIQNNLRSLEKRERPAGLDLPKGFTGYIRTVRRRKDDGGNLSNQYHFDPLIAVLKELAKEQNQRKKNARRRNPVP